MKADLQQACSAIASEIGPDVAEFTPSDEKNFLVEAAVIGMGGSFLLAFFKGVAKKAGEVAEEQVGDELGTAIGEAFASLLNRIRHKTPPLPDKELEEARQEAETAVKRRGLSPEQIAAVGQAVAVAMAAALSQESDPNVSKRVADRVKVEGLKVIEAGA
jgi:hypothetical protein